MIAWGVIGERALRELFPPPSKGGWPNHGHDGKLSDSFTDRRPGLVGWARAAFLISLPRAVTTRVLPGDSFFLQATHVLPGYATRGCAWLWRGESGSTCQFV